VREDVSEFGWKGAEAKGSHLGGPARQDGENE